MNKYPAILLILFFACRDVRPVTRNESDAPDKSVEIELPLEYNIKGELITQQRRHHWITHQANMLKLDPLHTGFDSLKLRVWLGHSMAYKKYLVIISYSGKQWNAEFITFELSHDPDADSYVYIQRQQVQPASGWEKLAGKLRELQITTIRYDDKNSGCGDDGMPYIFEMATATKYRMYYYCNPELYPDDWRHRNILEFATLLERISIFI